MRFDYILLTQEGKQPSNRIGSKYSAICKALAEYKKLVPRHVSYIDPAGQAKLRELNGHVTAFEASQHTGNWSGKQKKTTRWRR